MLPYIPIHLSQLARQLGIETCLEINSEILVPEERIRDLCLENKCGNYGVNYMCPPCIGSLADIDNKLKNYSHGLLLQYTRTLDVKGDIEALRETKIDFHHKILELEDFLYTKGFSEVWGLIGGSCELCHPCGARTNRPCPYSEQARPSLEALGIDVLGLLDSLGLDRAFHSERITWTGCLLVAKNPRHAKTR